MKRQVIPIALLLFAPCASCMTQDFNPVQGRDYALKSEQLEEGVSIRVESRSDRVLCVSVHDWRLALVGG